MVCRATQDTLLLPSAPTGLTLAADGTGITLDWNSNPTGEAVTSYKVYRASTNQGGPYSLLSTVTQTTKRDTSGSSGTLYWYRVSAVNTAGEGPYTDVSGSFTTDTTPPGEVTITTGPTQVGSTQVSLTWTPPTDSDYAGCKVYAKRDSGAYTLVSGSSLIVTNASTHQTATAGHDWTYKITTVDKVGNESTGTVSTTATIPGSDTTAPSVPQNVVAVGRSDGILVTWDSVADFDLLEYVLFIDGNDSGISVGPSPTSYLDTNTVVGENHYYQIRADDISMNTSSLSSVSNTTARLATSMNDLAPFAKLGTMAPCACFARGVDYRKYSQNSDSSINLVETLDFLALPAGTQVLTDYHWEMASSSQPSGLFTVLKGFSAAHAYDTPGKYTVTLTRTATNGKIDTFQTTVNLAQDTRTIVYCTPSGDNSSSNLGADSSKPVSPARAQAILNTTANVKIRLQNGATYLTGGTLFTFSQPNQMIGSYQFGTTSTKLATLSFSGPGTATRSMLAVKAGATNVVIQNFILDRTYTPSGSSQSTLDIGINVLGDGGTLVRGITINHIGSLVSCDNSSSKTTRYVLVQQCVAPNRDSLFEYLVYVQGQDIHVYGNSVANSLAAHPVRCSQHTRTNVSFNNLTDADHQQTDQFDVVRTPLTIQHGTDAYAFKNTLNADLSSSDALVGISKSIGSVSVGPLRGAGVGHRAEYTKYVVLESNTINAKTEVQHGSSHVCLKNNIINRDASQNVVVHQVDGTLDSAGLVYNILTDTIHVLNNTIYNGLSTGTLVRVESTVDNVDISNNHLAAPNASTNSNNHVCLDFRSGFGTNNIVQRNTLPTADAIRISSIIENTATFNLRTQANATNIKEATTIDSKFKPASNSQAATAARPKSGVYDDIVATTRQPKATTWTCGAYQL